MAVLLALVAVAGCARQPKPRAGMLLAAAPARAGFRRAVVIAPRRQVDRARWHALLAEAVRHEDRDAATSGVLDARLAALLTEENAGAICRGLSTDEQGSRFGLAALRRWLANDPVAAVGWLAEQGAPSDAQTFAAADRIAGDRRLVEELVARVSTTAWSDALVGALAARVADADPGYALALADRLRAGPARDQVRETVVYAWASRDGSAAARWIARLDDPEARAKLACLAAKACANRDPITAAEWVVAAQPSDAVFGETLQSIVAVWAERAPAAAAAFVERFPSGDLRRACTASVARAWLRRDASAASAWVAARPDAAPTAETGVPD